MAVEGDASPEGTVDCVGEINQRAILRPSEVLFREPVQADRDRARVVARLRGRHALQRPSFLERAVAPDEIVVADIGPAALAHVPVADRFDVVMVGVVARAAMEEDAVDMAGRSLKGHRGSPFRATKRGAGISGAPTSRL